MIESSFEFTISSKNKSIFIASGHEFYFKRKNKFTENEFAQNIKHINVEQLPLLKLTN